MAFTDTRTSRNLAANGYVVVFLIARLNWTRPGYAYAINADWGNKDFQDDMAMVDYAIAQGMTDPGKLGVFGWSYGGISTDFIIAQTNRFKAAISGAGASLFGSRARSLRTRLDYELATWIERAKPRGTECPCIPGRKHHDTSNVQGGDIDWNVPILGGADVQALKVLGRETKLVVYPVNTTGSSSIAHQRPDGTRPYGLPITLKQTAQEPAPATKPN